MRGSFCAGIMRCTRITGYCIERSMRLADNKITSMAHLRWRFHVNDHSYVLTHRDSKSEGL